jgi:hypothetical protein
LAGQPPLAADLRPAEEAPQEALAAAVRGWLERQRRWLLVLDNVEEPAAVAELLPRSGTGHVLLTSQAETGWEPLADSLPMKVLSPTDGAGFLLARTKQQGLEAEAAATTLASSLGGLPLALEQAAAYIVAAGTVNLAGYGELFATRALELLGRGQPLGYQHTVGTTWSLALQRLQEMAPAAVELLTLASFLAPDDVPQPLVVAHGDVLPEPLARTAADPLALGDAVAALRGFSLVRVVADGLFVHRLLQAVVRAGLDHNAERTWASAAIRLLRAGFLVRAARSATGRNASGCCHTCLLLPTMAGAWIRRDRGASVPWRAAADLERSLPPQPVLHRPRPTAGRDPCPAGRAGDRPSSGGADRVGRYGQDAAGG